MQSSRAVQTCSLEQWQCRVIAAPLSITQHHLGRKLIIFSNIQPQNGKMKTCWLKIKMWILSSVDTDLIYCSLIPSVNMRTLKMEIPVGGNHHVDCNSGHQPYCVDVFVYLHLFTNTCNSSLQFLSSCTCCPPLKGFIVKSWLKWNISRAPAGEQSKPGDRDGRWPANCLHSPYK